MKKLVFRVVMLMAVAGLMTPAMKSAAAEGCPAGGCCAAGTKVAAAEAKCCSMSDGCCAKGATAAATKEKCCKADGCCCAKDATAAAAGKKCLAECGCCCVGTEVAKKADAYPLEICPVTGGKLGSMGKPYVHTYQGREVRLCCKGCVKAFEKDAAKHLKTMDEAIIKKEKKDYPLTTCAVSGDKLGEMGEPIDYVARNNHLVRLCCKGCIKQIEKDAKPVLKKVDEAWKAAAAKKGAPEKEEKVAAKKS